MRYRLIVVVLMILSFAPWTLGQASAQTPVESGVDDDMVHIPAGRFLRGSTRSGVSIAQDLCERDDHVGRKETRFAIDVDCSCDDFIHDDIDDDRRTANCFEARWQDERPSRTIHLDDFYIDRTEVTVASYRACVVAGECSAPLINTRSCPEDLGTWAREDQAQYPVNCVSWSQAQQYCQWAGKRLPTEAEWEKVARGTDGRRFPWGNTPPGRISSKFANVAERSTQQKFEWITSWVEGVDDGFTGVAPVGQFTQGQSPYGVLDMSGNVEEWTSDAFQEDYYRWAPTRNPPGPREEHEHGWRVVRGGSFLSSADDVRVTERSALSEGRASFAVGFRCVKDVR